MSTQPPTYTLLPTPDPLLTPQEAMKALETGTEKGKIETMKQILAMNQTETKVQALLMHVIRFVMPCKNKQLKKMLGIYWEVCHKRGSDGKLKQEMILVCNALRNDLNHPNEFIRGSTLRVVSKIKESELLEPLIPTIRECLAHRHAYVRKHAVSAIFSVAISFPALISDAGETLSDFLAGEQDESCKRITLISLTHLDTPRAVAYFQKIAEQISNCDEHTQLAVLELIKKDSRNPKADKPAYIRCAATLLSSTYTCVKYDAAITLMSLTLAPTAVKEVASSYIALITKEPDNNVKLIVLQKLRELQLQHERILDDVALEVLRILASSDIEVRRKCLQIVLSLASNRNIAEIADVLKKELQKTYGQDYEKNEEYRRILIQTIHTCAIQFPTIAKEAISVLAEFMGDSNHSSAIDVVQFIREVMEKFPELRKTILRQLLENFESIKSGKVYRMALWVMSEYSEDKEDIKECISSIRAALGELPLLASEIAARELDGPIVEPEGPPAPKMITKTRVLADGTYATETALGQKSLSLSKLDPTKKSKPHIRSLLLIGDHFLGATLAFCLAKFVIKYKQFGMDREYNEIQAQAMLIMTSMLRLGRSSVVSEKIDGDSFKKIVNAIRSISEPDYETEEVLLTGTRQAFRRLIDNQETTRIAKTLNDGQVGAKDVEDVINFHQISSRKPAVILDQTEDVGLENIAGSEAPIELENRLSRIIQLTGSSDAVYAEAYVNVHQYDIIMDILLVNQTPHTLLNLSIEFTTLGDLKLVEKPSPYTMAGHSFHTMKANIKVSSTETGAIFGNIVYDTAAMQENCIILNDIHIDIMDYLHKGECNETEFRAMWLQFEWENKVNVNTHIKNLREYLNHVMKCTNMGCLTPEGQLEGECGVLAANLHAKSIFGEDALANVCLELNKDGAISGHIRIRSRTQGIALSLGDQITLKQGKALATKH